MDVRCNAKKAVSGVVVQHVTMPVWVEKADDFENSEYILVKRAIAWMCVSVENE